MKITHKDFVERLSKVNPDLEMLDEYQGANKKVHVRCKKDGYVWYVRASTIAASTKCPACSGNILLESEFLVRLASKNDNIEIIGNYVDTQTHVLAKCKVDGYEWLVKPNNLLQGKGCPVCGNNSLRKTHEQFIKELSSINNKVEVLDKYFKNNKKLKTRCLVDGNEWYVSPVDLLRGVGCPECHFNRIRKTHFDFVLELFEVSPHIEVIGDYCGCGGTIQVKCKKHNYVFKSTPSRLLKGASCPMCRKYGYSVEKPGFLYIIGFESFIGFGITNFPTARYASHNKTFKKHGITEILIAEISGSGRFINELERHLKVVLPIVDSGLEGFKTECILLGDKELLFTEIEAFKWKFGGLT